MNCARCSYLQSETLFLPIASSFCHIMHMPILLIIALPMYNYHYSLEHQICHKNRTLTKEKYFN